MSNDLRPIARLTGQFTVNLYLICAEIIGSCPDIIVGVFTGVASTIKVRIIVTICIVCYVNIKSRAKCRTIISMAVCCIT